MERERIGGSANPGEQNLWHQTHKDGISDKDSSSKYYRSEWCYNDAVKHCVANALLIYLTWLSAVCRLCFVKHSYLILLCWPCIQDCKISAVLGNPSSVLKMSLCFATLSAIRQSTTKPPVSGPLTPTFGLTTDWPGASAPPFVSNTLMRAVKLSKLAPVALRH